MALLDNLVHIKIKNMVDETGADPAKTDEEIRKINGKRDNNEAISDLENVIDYYETEVGVNTLTLQNIDMDKCNNRKINN